jgi:hypothetical protein
MYVWLMAGSPQPKKQFDAGKDMITLRKNCRRGLFNGELAFKLAQRPSILDDAAVKTSSTLRRAFRLKEQKSPESEKLRSPVLLPP